MPRGFQETEKTIIRTALIEKGKALFSSFGLKKTSIGDLTKAVGIAQGSFYNFFASKEELYFEILENEENAIKSALLKDFSSIDGSPKEIIKSLLTTAFELIDKNTFMKQLFVKNELEPIIRKLPGHKSAEHKRKDFLDLLSIIQKWRDEKIIIDKEPETIVGLLKSIFMIALHKSQIGEGVYEDAVTLLIELLAEGLADGRASV